MIDDEMKAKTEIVGRGLAEAFIQYQERYAAFAREVAREIALRLVDGLAQHIRREALLQLNGQELGRGGVSGPVTGSSGSQIRGNGFTFLIIDEFATVPTDLITMKKIKRPNKGPQGHIEPWKRRGRGGK